ncbi:MAG: hypothetical protein J6O17_05790 [Eubacterium sp.]|nr:hypothetical protein [Eubacterium sp.]
MAKSTDDTKQKKVIKIIRWLLLAAAASLVCFAAFRVMWKRGYFLPGWIKWEEKSEEHSFTVSSDPRMPVRSRSASMTLPAPKEGEEAEKITETVAVELDNKKLTVTRPDGELLWESDEGWLVSDYLIGDIDHDDEDELTLLVWKVGSYGEYKPIWVEEDEKKWSEHIFIYDYDVREDTRIFPLWMSSKMGIEARYISLDNEEKLHITIPEGKEAIWVWENWGLTLQE